jgi:hypothetical protein
MATLLRHDTWTSVTPYLGTKYALIGAGMLSCSQVGFNIALGPLAKLHERMGRFLARSQPDAEMWLTPGLLRADWAVYGVWRNPPDDQWCHEEPGGHILTPRPLLHLLNRMRHHPVEQGAWCLQGNCVRDEQDTLPFYRQRSFTVVERAWAGAEEQVRRQATQAMMVLWKQLQAWDLPIELNAPADPLDRLEPEAEYPGTAWPAAAFPLRIELQLPDVPPLNLATAELVSPEICAAYKLGQVHYATLGAGIERWCLALLVRFGIDPERWPDLGSLI